jgi:hypothetical protein
MPRHLLPAPEQRESKGNAAVGQQLHQDSELEACAQRVRTLKKATTENLIQLGKELIFAQERLGRGRFGKWLDDMGLGITDRTARRYMQLANWADANPDIVSGLEPTAAYLLSAPSTPVSVVSEVKALISGGEAMPTERVRTLVSKARLDQQQNKGKRPASKRKVPTRHHMESPKVARCRRKQERAAAKDFARLVGERASDIAGALFELLAKTEAAALVDALKAELERRAARTLTSPSEEVALPAPATPVSDPLEIPEALRRVSPATSGEEAGPRDEDQLK